MIMKLGPDQHGYFVNITAHSLTNQIW